MNNQTAAEAYEARRAEILGQLAWLTEEMRQPPCAPPKITWAHVGDLCRLQHILQQACEIIG